MASEMIACGGGAQCVFRSAARVVYNAHYWAEREHQYDAACAAATHDEPVGDAVRYAAWRIVEQRVHIPAHADHYRRRADLHEGTWRRLLALLADVEARCARNPSSVADLVCAALCCAQLRHMAANDMRTPTFLLRSYE